ncbi:Uncharacterised protein g4279 [Pycnogonum litorale]
MINQIFELNEILSSSCISLEHFKIATEVSKSFLCVHCRNIFIEEVMSAIPPIAFSVNDFKFHNKGSKDKKVVISMLPLARLPDRYNVKFMKSVWGMYNRYGPHSFQKNAEPALFGGHAASVGSVYAKDRSELCNSSFGVNVSAHH